MNNPHPLDKLSALLVCVASVSPSVSPSVTPSVTPTTADLQVNNFSQTHLLSSYAEHKSWYVIVAWKDKYSNALSIWTIFYGQLDISGLSVSLMILTWAGPD